MDEAGVKQMLREILKDANRINSIFIDTQDYIFKQKFGQVVDYNLVIQTLDVLHSQIYPIKLNLDMYRHITLFKDKDLTETIEGFLDILSNRIQEFDIIVHKLYKKSNNDMKYSFFTYQTDIKKFKMQELLSFRHGKMLQEMINERSIF